MALRKGHHSGCGMAAAAMVGMYFLPSFHLANRASDVSQTQNQQKTNHQSHQISPSIFGRLGHFKRPSFAHAWCEDACAAWLHSSAILGSAGLGLAFGRHGLIVYCGGMVRIVCTLTSKHIRLNIHIDSTG